MPAIEMTASGINFSNFYCTLQKTEIGIHLGMQRCSLTLQARGNHLNKPPMHSAVFNLHFALILP